MKNKKDKKKSKKYSINFSKTNGNFFENDKNISKNIDLSNSLINSKGTDNNNIDISNINKTEYNNNIYKAIMNLNDYELNTLQYKDAIKKDKRTFFEFYISLLKINHIIIFSFCRKHDYNSKIIKIYLFFFSFILSYVVNALFFSDSTIHQIFVDGGSYNFIYQIPQIIYSSLISSIVNIIIKTLSLSEKNILEIKHEKIITNLQKKSKEIIKYLYINFKLFFIICFLFLLFFWYYISCFCAIYKNSQIHLIKDTLISFGLSLLLPFFICLIPGIFRIPSLRTSGKNLECIYKISKIIQTI